MNPLAVSDWLKRHLETSDAYFVILFAKATMIQLLEKYFGLN